MTERAGDRSGRRVVAVVVDRYEPYQRLIVGALARRLGDVGYGVLCIAGRDLQARDAMLARTAREMFHPIVRQIDVRGTIVLSTVLGHGYPVDDVRRFVERLAADAPVVSLGVAFPGLPGVTLDDEAALEALMRHMTRDPLRRRFVFLRGFAGDPDTRTREAAFRRVLERRGLPVDERLVLEGRYRSAESYAAIDALLCAGVRFDAVIAASDVMAASAIAALGRHGLSVPDDVLVSGFDDDRVALEIQPPLTTVRNRIERQAEAAADLMLDALAGVRPSGSAMHVAIEAELVVRGSSGAGAPDRSLGPERSPALADADIDRRTALGARLHAALGGVPPPPGVDPNAFVESFLDTLLDGSAHFPDSLERQFAAFPMVGDDIRWWRHASAELVRTVGDLVPGGSHPAALATLTRALDAMAGARRVSRLAAGFEQVVHRELQETLLARLAGCKSVAAIREKLGEGLPALGVERAWVVLHDDARAEDDPSGDATMRLAFTLSESGPDPAETRFGRSAILPPRWRSELERGVLVLSPLAVGERELGFLLVDPCRSARLELAALATGIALALHQVHLVDDLQRRADALRVANGTLVEVARRDPLTGLANRARFHENLEEALELARRGGGGFSLLFLDLDGFKLINDTLGHGAGDQLLRIVASRVDALLEADTSFARLGGDEFTVIVPETRERRREAAPEPPAGVAISERVLAAVARPVRLGERVVNVSTSIGIARYPEDGTDLETLVRNADTAMYHAKACGKSRHARYTPALNGEALAELELREAIRHGLEAGEFHLHFQPRVELGSDALVAFEALSRWTRADGVETGPARYVPVAERCGLIAALDALSLDAACAQAGLWAADGMPVSVSVNLSVKRLQEPTIVEQVVAALRRHRLDPVLLELEITESAAMTDVEANIVKLGALRALGVRIAIDDFGTGHSSLSYLRRLPVNSLKIDRSFLSHIDPGGDPGAGPTVEAPEAAIVRAIVALGRSLGFRVVA